MNSIKRVALFVHSYPPAKGGLEYLAEKIVAAISSEYTVEVFTGKGINLDSYKNLSEWVTTDGDVSTIHRLPLDIWKQKIANIVLRPFLRFFPSLAVFYFGPALLYSDDEVKTLQECDVFIGMGLPTKSLLDASRFAQQFRKPLVSIPAYHSDKFHQKSSFFKKVFDLSTKILFLSPSEQ